MIERIKLLNSQAFTALATTVSFWTLGFTFKIALMTNKIDVNSTIEGIIIELLSALFFLIPIIVFLPLSVKSGENLTQIASLSAYIRVFYEYPISGKKINRNWETSNNLLSNANVDRHEKSRIMKLYNEEYTLLSLISLLIYIVMSMLHIKKVWKLLVDKKVSQNELYSIIAVYIISAIFATMLIILIHNATTMKNSMMKSTVYYVQGYIKRANEIGVIKDEDLEKAIYELNPLKEFNDIRGQTPCPRSNQSMNKV